MNQVADVTFATGPTLFKTIILNKEKLVVFTAHRPTLHKLIQATYLSSVCL